MILQSAGSARVAISLFWQPFSWNRKQQQREVASFVIRASEQARSFNPWFRWVSPIHSANPRWNVTACMSLSLRYGSTDAACRVASWSRWTKLTAFRSGYCRCSMAARRGTKMADGCWVHRGVDEDGDDVETQGCQSLPCLCYLSHARGRR